MSKTIRLLIPRSTRWAFFVCSFSPSRSPRARSFRVVVLRSSFFCRVLFTDSSKMLSEMPLEATTSVEMCVGGRRASNKTYKNIVFFYFYFILCTHNFVFCENWQRENFPVVFVLELFCWMFPCQTEREVSSSSERECSALNNFLNAFRWFPLTCCVYVSCYAILILASHALVVSVKMLFFSTEKKNFVRASTTAPQVLKAFFFSSFVHWKLLAAAGSWKLNNETFFSKLWARLYAEVKLSHQHNQTEESVKVVLSGFWRRDRRRIYFSAVECCF